jgi:hypothetical protein
MLISLFSVAAILTGATGLAVGLATGHRDPTSVCLWWCIHVSSRTMHAMVPQPTAILDSRRGASVE